MLVMIGTCMIDSECAHYSGHNGNIRRIELTPSSKGYETAYRKQFAVVPDTNQGLNVLVLDRAVLDLPNPLADPDTCAELIESFARRHHLHDGHMSAAIRVRERIMSSIGDPPGLESMAKSLRMTSRQLRLALSREDASYQQIVRACRIEYASILFKNPGLSLSQIAERLGYSDLSAFTHAFCRWTGKSPSTFRIEMLSQSASL
jgi:AraC-like DNA-binding protein